jgi:PleD family two-component response regulator
MTPQPAKPRVLIVDDNAANRMAFESVLENDFTVTLAESGRQALDLVKRDEFAVILLDVRMPGMDGFETAELLRERWATRYTPIIFTSSYDQHLAQVKRGFVAGATDYLFSPVDSEILAFKVSTYVAMYLRYRAVNLQMQQLQKFVRSLLDEVDRPGSSEELLKDMIRQLESALDDLQRQIPPLPA